MTETTIDTPRGRQRPKMSDVVGTGILALVGLVALIMGFDYGFIGENDQIGPGFMPAVVGGFILIASLAEIARLFLAPQGQHSGGLGGVAEELSAEAAAAQDAARQETANHGDLSPADASDAENADGLDTFGRTARQRNVTVVLIFAILFAAVLLTQVIGMLLSLTLMMFSIVVFVEKKPIVPSLLISAGVLVVAYLIFVQMLGVPVPQGMLGIL